MRVPLSWVKDYVDITLPVEELAHRLTLAGLEVAAIEYIGVPAGDAARVGRDLAVPISSDHLVWEPDKIVVGYIHEVKPHPNADRLVLAMVDHGAGELEQVVTGAPNLFPYKGKGPLDKPLAVAFAREGAELMDPYAEEPGARMTLKPRKLRGIENRTMVLSERELGISDEHEGIMILETDAPPGTPLRDVIGDVILDIELTPNFARAFSILGVAREIAALTGQKLRYPPLDVQTGGEPIEGQAAIEIRDPSLNPRFMLALIRDVKIGPSPDWMQRRLRKVGMRPINNVVDITNYVMIETGQPLHAFDYDMLVRRAGGKPPTIITRTAEPGEKLTTLDGVERKLDPFTELVADTAGPLSLAGIMGGLESEVEETTTNVLLEAANWNFINIRQTLLAQRARGEEINSEAGARFSRGVHPALAEVGLRRAAELMRQIAGGTVARGFLDNYPAPAPTITVDLPLTEVERIIGIPLSQDEVARLLESLEFKVERVGGATPDSAVLRVTVPPHRMDIGVVSDPAHEDIADSVAQADLLEEIARVYGYDKLPNTLIEDELPPQRTNVALVREQQVSDLLVRAGLQEVINYRLTTPAREALLLPPGTPGRDVEPPYVRIANPMSRDRTVMRRSLLPGLLDNAAANSRWRDRIALFEIGKVYLPVEGEKLPAEPRRLGILLMGRRDLPAWQDPLNAEVEQMDFFDLKGVVEALVGALHLPDVRFEEANDATYFPGRVAKLVVGGREVGKLGELHPLVREAFDLPEKPVLVADIDLDALLADVSDLYPVQPVASYPAIYQDIAIVVHEDVPAADVERVIRQAGGTLLRDVRLFDVYRGEQIGANQKSLAYALTFQAQDRTLRDRDADAMRARIVRALEEAFGAQLRA
ncbi:MAG TPA: phenylalanine--tRNA ligase subunit beta [Aggregatilineales bacterium]|nr:phenylalanine--tRNA ligase subunit beta [Aggregatilineales bacterium]